MLKRKWTWLDTAVLVLVILAIAAAAWYFTRGNKIIAGEQNAYTVTMRFTRETTHPTDYYQVGDQIYQINKTLIGEIVSLEEKDLKTEEFNPATGEYEVIVDPLKKQVEMKVKANGNVKSGVLVVNGEELYVGQKIYPQGNKTRSTVEIWAIEEVAQS